MGRARESALWLPVCLALAFLLLATAAQAAAPLKIREAFPGTPAQPGAEYATLQMSADDQGEIEGQELRFYAANGDLAATYALTQADAEGLIAQSQRTVLAATEAAGALLGGDAAAPDVVLPAGERMDPAGGAICFTEAGGGSPADCVTWGSFPVPGFGDPPLIPDSQSANAPAFPSSNAAEEALERDIITRGCETYLDGPDDSGSSEADFNLAAPAPRNNATAPSEIRCPPPTGILSGPVSPFANPTNDPDASFTYAALTDEEGVEFQCHLDSDPGSLPPATPPSEGEWEGCDAQPKAYPGLPDGFHRFWVRAKGENPEWGEPANRGWEIDTVPPSTTIDAVPPSPNSGFAVGFSYSSSEPFSSFRCRLDDGAIQNCGSSASSGQKTYFDLIDGHHTFRVRATDNAGNTDPTPATHSFLVQRFLGDVTPPDTRILTAPPNPSRSPHATFAYGSTEPGSTFQCRLDTAPFAPCSALGAPYGPLPNGRHVFQVRAIDRAGNADSTPAAHAWRVAAPVPNTRFTRAPGGALRSRRGKPVRVSFRFRSSKPGSVFRCRADLTGPYRPCRSPHRFRAKPGRHVFEVFATDALGNEEGTPAFRIFRVRAPGPQRSFFAQSGRFLSSLDARIAPTKLPRRGLRPASLRFGSTFENLDGTDIPQIATMTLRLARGGALQTRGLPRCSRARLAQRSARAALAACRGALVGRGTVSTALRFPEGRRSRSTARLLLFNARGALLMHVHATDPLEGVFVIGVRIRRTRGLLFGTELRADFPRIAAGFGRVTGFRMKIHRLYRHRGERRSYLLAGCPATPPRRRVTFQLARADYRFRGGLRIVNSAFASCRVRGR